MIVGVGVDLVKISRIRAAAERWGDRFLTRVFTEREQTYARRRREPAPHLAGRFAVKEAVFKALGVGWRLGVRWREVEVVNNAQGKPELVLTGQTKGLSETLGVTVMHVSLSHDSDYAIAEVIFSAPSVSPSPSPSPSPSRGEGKMTR